MTYICSTCTHTHNTDAKPRRCHRCRSKHLEYHPSKDEIATACFAIQQTWTPHEEEAHRRWAVAKEVDFTNLCYRTYRRQNTGRKNDAR